MVNAWGETAFQLFHMFHVCAKLICHVKIAALVVDRVQRAGFTSEGKSRFSKSEVHTFIADPVTIK